MALPGLVAGIPAATPTTLAVSAVLTFLTLCVGHSVGLHRGLIHRTYEAHPIVRGTLAYLFVLSGLGGPLSWARLHAVRDLWQNRLDCPRYFAYRHSAAHDFLWNLHLRFEPADDRASARLPPDVLGDRWLQFLEYTWPLHVLALALGILAILGPGGVAVCVCARTAASITGHWFVGYAARVGRAPLRDPRSRRDRHERLAPRRAVVRRGLPQQPSRPAPIGADGHARARVRSRLAGDLRARGPAPRPRRHGVAPHRRASPAPSHLRASARG